MESQNKMLIKESGLFFIYGQVRIITCIGICSVSHVFIYLPNGKGVVSEGTTPFRMQLIASWLEGNVVLDSLRLPEQLSFLILKWVSCAGTPLFVLIRHMDRTCIHKANR